MHDETGGGENDKHFGRVVYVGNLKKSKQPLAFCSI